MIRTELRGHHIEACFALRQLSLHALHQRIPEDVGNISWIRSALKKTAAVKKMLERQLLAIKNAMLVSQQAQASQQFAESMNLMAQQIAQIFGQRGQVVRWRIEQLGFGTAGESRMCEHIVRDNSSTELLK